MKVLQSGCLALVLAGMPAALPAQNFAGGDDFSGGLGNWTPGAPAGASFVASAGLLNFTCPEYADGIHSASLVWNQNQGSAVADWQLQIDLSVLVVVPELGQRLFWDLQLTNSADSSDYVIARHEANHQPGGVNRFVWGVAATDGGWGTDVQANTTSTVSLRAAYSASSRNLTISFDPNGPDGGASFTPLLTADLTAWNMQPADTFLFKLSADTELFFATAPEITAGLFTADNFAATAVPELPWSASFAAGLALTAALVRRRRTG